MTAGYGRGYYGENQLARPPRGNGWIKFALVAGVGAVAVWLMWPRRGEPQARPSNDVPPAPLPPSSFLLEGQGTEHLTALSGHPTTSGPLMSSGSLTSSEPPLASMPRMSSEPPLASMPHMLSGSPTTSMPRTSSGYPPTLRARPSLGARMPSSGYALQAPPTTPGLGALQVVQAQDTQFAQSRSYPSVREYEDAVVASAKQLKDSGAQVIFAPHLAHLASRLER